MGSEHRGTASCFSFSFFSFICGLNASNLTSLPFFLFFFLSFFLSCFLRHLKKPITSSLRSGRLIFGSQRNATTSLVSKESSESLRVYVSFRQSVLMCGSTTVFSRTSDHSTFRSTFFFLSSGCTEQHTGAVAFHCEC